MATERSSINSVRSYSCRPHTLRNTTTERQGDFVADLGPGDYLVWDGCYPHTAENIRNVTARVLIVPPGPTGIPIESGRREPADGGS